MYLTEKFCANGYGVHGTVRLRSARIGGRLYCKDAELTNPDGPALHAARVQVDSSMQLTNLTATGHCSDGAVRLYGARIGGNLYFTGAQLCNKLGPAMNGDMLRVGEVAFFHRSFRAVGHGEHATIRLVGANIGRGLQFGGCAVHNVDGPALDLRLVSVNVLMFSSQAFSQLNEENSGQQPSDRRLLLDGLTYTTIPPKPDLDQWLGCLHHSTPYASQPYQQLASVHRAAGEEANARRILIAQQDDLGERGHLGGQWAKARHRLLGLTIGYGYRTWRAFVGLAVVLILAMGLGLLAGHIHGDDRWVAAHTDKAGTDQAGTPCSTAEQIGLGVERALPLIINWSGIRDRCVLDSSSVPGQVLTTTGWILQIAAWALAALAIAGYTGLVRKI
jgi:hypothetical protein